MRDWPPTRFYKCEDGEGNVVFVDLGDIMEAFFAPDFDGEGKHKLTIAYRGFGKFSTLHDAIAQLVFNALLAYRESLA